MLLQIQIEIHGMAASLAKTGSETGTSRCRRIGERIAGDDVLGGAWGGRRLFDLSPSRFGWNCLETR